MASKAIGFLNFKFGADLSGFEKAMKKAQKNLKKFGKSIQKTGKSLTMGLTLPIVGLGIASVKAFDEQAKAIAQVEAGLKSTGNQVGITSEKLQQMAADLQKTSLFGDEQILSDVTAQLLTFTGIAKEQFGEAQLAVVNLSSKLKTDLKSTAIMVGKALNDPITQLSALSRNGVKFTEEQTLLIKSLVEMGDAAGAQAIILKELETQFGGSAEAARKAGIGGIQGLQMQLMDLSEQIGARLVPHIEKLTKFIVVLAKKFDNLTESQKDNLVIWGLIIAAIGPVLIIIGKISIGVSTLISVFIAIGGVIISTMIPAFKALFAVMIANPFGAMLATLGLLAAGITALVSSNDDATDSTNTLTESQKKLQEELEETARVERSLAFMRNDKASQEIYLAERRLMFKEKLANANTKEEKQLAKAQIQLSDLRDNVAFWGQSLENTLDQEGYDLSLEYYKDAQKAVEDQIDVVGKLHKEVVKQNKVINEGTEEIKMYSEAVEILSTEFLFMQSKAEDQFKNMIFWTKELTLAQKLNNAGWLMFGDIVTSSLDSALDSQENFFNLFLKNIKRAIRSLLIQLAVMTVIQSLMGVPAAFTTANLSKNLSTLMGVTAFAEGGLVTGPTTALIGEGVGTTASNPEVVAPLDKLKQYMVGGNQNIIVEGVLKGNDIYLSNRNTSINRLRTT